MPLSPEIELGSHDLLMDFAEAGLGVSCVVREFAAARLREGRLVELDVRPALPERAADRLAELLGVRRRAVSARYVREIPRSGAGKILYRELEEAP